MSQELKRRKELRSKAKRTQCLFTKQKKLLGSYFKAIDLKPPILELMRRDGSIELYEKATKGQFVFTHSDGEERSILLDPADQYKHSYLDRHYMGYKCHEDYFKPLPHSVIISTETLSKHEQNLQQSIIEMQAKLERAKSIKWKYVIYAMAIIIGGIILMGLLGIDIPGLTNSETTKIVQVVNNTLPTGKLLP